MSFFQNPRFTYSLLLKVANTYLKCMKHESCGFIHNFKESSFFIFCIPTLWYWKFYVWFCGDLRYFFKNSNLCFLSWQLSIKSALETTDFVFQTIPKALWHEWVLIKLKSYISKQHLLPQYAPVTVSEVFCYLD